MWIVNVDGSGLRKLTDAAEGADCAHWSPDGKYLAGFHWRTDSDGERVALYSLESNSYTVFPKTYSAAAWVAWLNDSRRLIVSSGEADERSRIVILDTQSGETRAVLSSEAVSAAPGVEPGVLFFPAVSSDNRELYIDWRCWKGDIWLLTLEEQE